MIIVDAALRELEASGSPIGVGLVGAGFMAQGLANQIVNSVPGMRLVAVAGRRLERAAAVVRYAGLEPLTVDSPGALDTAHARGRTAITDDPLLLCRSGAVDVIVEATGAVDYAAHVVLEAFAHGKDVVLMNAELDATIGPILQVKAREHGVIMSACDGDEPGVQLNLVRWVRGLGLVPRVVGNVKGLQDPYRNPTTQRGFAERWGQNPAMVTSFADGTKISCEQAIVANATGFKVLQRGMSRGREFRELPEKLPELYLPMLDEIRAPGRGHRLHGRDDRDQGLRPGGARGPQAAPLPRAVQDGPGSPVRFLGSLPPRPLRGAERDRSRPDLPGSPGPAAGRSGCGGVCRCQAATSSAARPSTGTVST